MGPNFNEKKFLNAPNVSYEEVEIENVAPDNYHSMSIYPEYFKINGKWILAKESRMDGVVVINDNLELEVKEFRNLNIGDKVIVGRTEEASEGIYLHANGFSEIDSKKDILHLEVEDLEKYCTLKIMNSYMNYLNMKKKMDM